VAAWHERLDVIESDAPWYEPWRDCAGRVARELREGASLHEALNRHGSGDVHFVAAHSLPAGTPYEQFIFETSQCPTREGVHDFFNGLAWLNLPLSKRQLNRLQAVGIAAHGVRGERGPLRDAITIFDENGAVLSAPAPLWEALRQRDWRRLFIDLRPMWREARLLVFGHALLEKLLRPRKNLTAHVLDLAAPLVEWDRLDHWLAAQLTAGCLGAKPFVPLPLLGIPGWAAENENFSFYDDRRVFRPPRS
jgi:hypothetical protein